MTFEDLVGCKIISISGVSIGSDAVVFQLDDGRKFKLYHSQRFWRWLGESNGYYSESVEFSEVVSE